MIALVYVRDGLAYGSKSDWEVGMEFGRIEVVAPTGDDRFRLDVAGRSYRSTWSWSEGTAAPFGAVPFLALPTPCGENKSSGTPV